MARKSDKPKPIKKKKVYVTFDENARKDYLTGFRKRRNERKLNAQHMLDKKLKDKIKQERVKRKKKTQEKVTKLLEGINVPGETDSTDQVIEEQDKVDFGTHEVVIKSCIDYSESGLIIAHSKDDKEKDEVGDEEEVEAEEAKIMSIPPEREKGFKKKKSDLKHGKNKSHGSKKKFTKNKKQSKEMKQKGKHKK